MDTEPNAALAAMSDISRAQFADIVAAAAVDGVRFDTEPQDATLGPAYIWQAEHILVSPDVDENSDDFLRKVDAVLSTNLDGSPQQTAPDRVKLLTVAPGTDVRTLVDSLNEQFRATKVWLNYLVSITAPAQPDPVNLCPADEPRPVRPYPATVPYPPPSSGMYGHDVTVEVIDTGLTPGWETDHPWLYDADRQPPTDVSGDLGETIGQDDQIEVYAGHGTFIAGIVRCVAPRARVHVSNTLRWAGAMTEFEVANVVHAQLDAGSQPDIISLSAGCATLTGQPPQTMVDVLARLRAPACRTLLVAAAGNDGRGPATGTAGTFYPAAFAGPDPYSADHVVVAVGALRADRLGRACFSNYENWVTVYEDGERLVNAFPTGKYTCHEPRTSPPVCVYHSGLEDGCTCVTAAAKGAHLRFNGMAEWSGTSFAVPVIVGRVARHLTDDPTRFNGDPRAAWADLVPRMKEIPDAGDGIPLNIFPVPAGG
ncbi:MAG TPA: S8/S53 family peptidase [Pseudonocardiaceae bacterium]|nr:S8/S53 family peptidase [Pseudonocardiaceae bacterium]